MNPIFANVAYLVAAVLFIIGIKRLSSPATARSGNQAAAVGMLIAVVVTLLDMEIIDFSVIVAGLVFGGAVGAVLARRVQMTAMPQLVAIFNGFGGGASAFVAASELLRTDALPVETRVTIAISALVGAVTLSGSMVAFGKLQGIVPGRPVSYPGHRFGNTVVLGVALGAGAAVGVGAGEAALWLLSGAALLIGVLRVLPIGGADMPVVIALLNAASGIAAAAAGFVIERNVLIIAGALVGASGLILTGIMVKAMNRTLAGVLFEQFGTGDGIGPTGEQKPVRSGRADEFGILLAYARSVIVVPGYGLAVAQAQYALHGLATLLESRNVEVRYAIHPVAGRMPGHMNVLLAEADVPYERLFDLDDINGEFPQTDVALVVGANDVVNPSAREDQSSPIFGMPILDVDKAKSVIVIKRSLSPGFAGVDNPLFYFENTTMFFSDAKVALNDLATAVREA